MLIKGNLKDYVVLPGDTVKLNEDDYLYQVIVDNIEGDWITCHNDKLTMGLTYMEFIRQYLDAVEG